MQEYRNTTPYSVPDNGSSGRRLAIAGAFTGILVMAMAIKSDSAETAILGGAALFGAAYLVEAINHSPLLIARTVARIDQETTLALRSPAAHIVEPLRLPAETPQTGRSTFVTPVDLSTAKDAVLWCLSLYGPDGQPDPAKINLKGDREAPGRLRVAAPASAAKEWLIAKRVLDRIDHGYRLRVSRFPTADTIRGLLS